MKHLTTTLCIVLLSLSAVTGYSQNKKPGKPTLFINYPASLHCTETQLESFFTAAKGQNINVVLANDFMLSGLVTSKEAKYGNLQTIVIQLPAFNNTLFSLSKQTDQNNNAIYVGRIINPSYSDGYELKRDATGIYQLVKIDLEKILVNCNQ